MSDSIEAVYSDENRVHVFHKKPNRALGSFGFHPSSISVSTKEKYS